MGDRPADGVARADVATEHSGDAPSHDAVLPRGDVRGSRWRMHNWRLRTKVMAVIIVPTITALILAGLRAYGDLEHASALRQTVSQVRVAQQLTNLVQELQKERTLAVAWVASGKKIPRTELNTQIDVVDEAVTSARNAVERLDTGDTATKRRYQVGLQRLDALGAIRKTAEKTDYPEVGVYTTYSSIVESVHRLGSEVNVAVTDRDLLDAGTVIQSLSEAKEGIAKQNAILQVASFRESFPAELLSQLRDARASADGAIANYRANASAGQLQLYSDTVSGPEVDERERILAGAIATVESAPRDSDETSTGGIDTEDTGTGSDEQQRAKVDVDHSELTTAGTATIDHLREVEAELLGDMRDKADELAAAASRSAVQDSVIVFVALVLALLLMGLVTRTLLKPLRMLRREALEVANHRLPNTVRRILGNPDPAEAAKQPVEPVAVFTHEETGQVARAFDAVQEQAVRMATEQALLRDNINSIFVNLSRRSQSLVERQLSLIDGLESDEQDPDQLSALFQLDHLATRMRRNSESLLVLSGVGLSRQFTRPVPAGEVVGAAVSEVEQYARIEVAQAPQVTVQGRVASDLVHLIAELLDNATFFSEPEKKVKVRLAMMRSKALGIQITDQGVGMTENDIEVANGRLADPPDLDVAVTRRMGLYVVARLAKRHDIEVRLRENEDIDGGLIARVVVPSDVVERLQTPTATPTAPGTTTVPALTASETVSGTALFGTALAAGGGLPAGSNGDRADYYYLPSNGTDAEQPAEAPADPLPIYEAVSRWFETTSNGRSAAATGASRSNGSADTPAEADGANAANATDATNATDADAADAEQPRQPWHSPGDEGWRAAETLLGSTPDHATTTAGLPKRVPKAQLVPASVQSSPTPPADNQHQAQPPQPLRQQRSADVVRGRMSRFQEGTRRGRHAATDTEAGQGTEPNHQGESGPEENSQHEEQD